MVSMAPLSFNQRFKTFGPPGNFISCYKFHLFSVMHDNSKKLHVFCKLLRNEPTGLCFHLYAMIQTYMYLHQSNYSPEWG